MKLRTSVLTLVLVGTAMAQTPSSTNATAPTKPKATAAKAVPSKPSTATTTSAKPATKTMTPAKPAALITTPVKTAARSAQKPVARAKVKAAAKAKTVKKTDTTAKLAEKSDEDKDSASKAAPELKKRDPFVSVIMARDTGAPCAGAGKKCLIIEQVMLKGIVRSQSGSIAVVTGLANKTYFLRESDPVYNGVVVKITPDSIVFRESVTDRLGKTTQREVVKKVNNSAV